MKTKMRAKARRNLDPSMDQKQAYDLGYGHGYAKGRDHAAETYRRVLALLQEERDLNTMIRNKFGL